MTKPCSEREKGFYLHTSLGVFLDITEEEVGFTWPFPKPLAGYGAFSGKYLQLLDGKGVVVFYGHSWLVMPNRLGRLGRLGPVHARCRANTGLKNCIVFPPQTRDEDTCLFTCSCDPSFLCCGAS